MFEAWRKWRYPRYEAKFASADDFAEFEKLASGPWTPDMVSRVPFTVLMKGPQFGDMDAKSQAQTQKVIDLEIERRVQSRQPMIGHAISFLALVVAAIALYRSW